MNGLKNELNKCTEKLQNSFAEDSEQILFDVLYEYDAKYVFKEITCSTRVQNANCVDVFSINSPLSFKNTTEVSK